MPLKEDESLVAIALILKVAIDIQDFYASR
jgi:hypothetical protein